MGATAFLVIDGIPGTSHVAGHESEIEVEGWSFGAAHPYMYGQSTGEAQVQALSLQFQSGTHSALMFQSVVLGTVAPKVTLKTFATDRGKKEVLINEIVLTSAVLSSYMTNFSHAGGGVSLSESITIESTQIDIKTGRIQGDNLSQGSYKARVNK